MSVLLVGRVKAMGRAARLMQQAAEDIGDEVVDQAIHALSTIVRSRIKELQKEKATFKLDTDTKAALKGILGSKWAEGKFDEPFLDDLIAAQHLLSMPLSKIIIQ